MFMKYVCVCVQVVHFSDTSVWHRRCWWLSFWHACTHGVCWCCKTNGTAAAVNSYLTYLANSCRSTETASVAKHMWFILMSHIVSNKIYKSIVICVHGQKYNRSYLVHQFHTVFCVARLSHFVWAGLVKIHCSLWTVMVPIQQ